MIFRCITSSFTINVESTQQRLTWIWCDYYEPINLDKTRGPCSMHGRSKTCLLGKPWEKMILQNSEMWMEGPYWLIHSIHLIFHVQRHGALWQKMRIKSTLSVLQTFTVTGPSYRLHSGYLIYFPLYYYMNSHKKYTITALRDTQFSNLLIKIQWTLDFSFLKGPEKQTKNVQQRKIQNTTFF
jgi:hypothetical protein